MTEATGRRRGGFGAFPGRERQAGVPGTSGPAVGVAEAVVQPANVEEATVAGRSTTRADKTTVRPDGEDA